jgi:hypothetical protein
MWPLIGAVARAAAPAIGRAVAGRAATFVASRGGAAAVGRQALGVVAKTPALRAGMIGYGLGKMSGGGRQENFNNWFPGSQDQDGTMY